MNRYRTGEDFRQAMERRRREQQVGAGGQGPIFESPPAGAPPEAVPPPNVPSRVLGTPPEAVLEAATMLPEDVQGPGMHVPQFSNQPIDVDDVNTGSDFPQLQRGEQIFGDVAARVLQGGKKLDYDLGLTGDNDPIANRQKLPWPYSSEFDIVRDPTDPAFGQYPLGGSRERDSSGQLTHIAPRFDLQEPVVNAAGEVVR